MRNTSNKQAQQIYLQPRGGLRNCSEDYELQAVFEHGQEGKTPCSDDSCALALREVLVESGLVSFPSITPHIYKPKCLQCKNKNETYLRCCCCLESTTDWIPTHPLQLLQPKFLQKSAACPLNRQTLIHHTTYISTNH